jgi:hypothetical protein
VVASTVWRRFLAFLKTVFAREELAPPPAIPEPGRGRRRTVSLLFAFETLPFDPEEPRRRRPGFWRAMLGREHLGEAPPSPRPRRTRWLRWLFGRESLDDPSGAGHRGA